MKNLDLENTNNLDESFSNLSKNYVNAKNDKYSNADGDAKSGGLSPEAIDALIKAGTSIIGVGANVASNRSNKTCKKPLIRENFTNRGKWSDYKKCLQDVADERNSNLEIERQKTEAERLRASGNSSKTETDAMNPALKWTLIGGGILLLVGGIITTIVLVRKK